MTRPDRVILDPGIVDEPWDCAGKLPSRWHRLLAVLRLIWRKR